MKELTESNMPFTIGIQNEWQWEVMLKHGHKGGVAVDATFGMNEKNVHFTPLQCCLWCTMPFIMPCLSSPLSHRAATGRPQFPYYLCSSLFPV